MATTTVYVYITTMEERIPNAEGNGETVIPSQRVSFKTTGNSELESFVMSLLRDFSRIAQVKFHHITLSADKSKYDRDFTRTYDALTQTLTDDNGNVVHQVKWFEFDKYFRSLCFCDLSYPEDNPTYLRGMPQCWVTLNSMTTTHDFWLYNCDESFDALAAVMSLRFIKIITFHEAFNYRKIKQDVKFMRAGSNWISEHNVSTTTNDIFRFIRRTFFSS